jgi:hypothetical protein
VTIVPVFGAFLKSTILISWRSILNLEVAVMLDALDEQF